MSDAITLETKKRDVIGKQVRQLRREGLIPAVVYGPARKDPLSVMVDWTTLRPVLLKAGGTELVQLQVEGNNIPVLIHTVQRHPVRGDVMHIDFYAVDMNATLQTSVHILLLDAEEHGRGMGFEVIQGTTMVNIECLPNKIPHQIEIDLSGLKREGDVLTVGDLPQLEGVEYLDDPDTVIARIVMPAGMSDVDEDLDTPVEVGEVEVIRRRREDEEGEE